MTKGKVIHELFKVKETSLSLLIVIPKQVFKTFMFHCSKLGCLLRSLYLFPVFSTAEDMLMPTVIFKHSVRVTKVPEASFNYKICHYWEQSQHLRLLKTQTWRKDMAPSLLKKRARVLETQDHPYSSLNSNHRNGGSLRYKKFSQLLSRSQCFQHFGVVPFKPVQNILRLTLTRQNVVENRT